MERREIDRLHNISYEIRKHAITAVYSAQSGHPGGSMSIAEILSVLYFHTMKIDPTNLNMSDRDRFVLSKGHASPGLYGALAERGYFDKEEIKSFRNINSFLQGHPDLKKVPGVDMSTGSLGQGLSAANGTALVGKYNLPNFSVYAIIGDGESQEGQIWEAIMTASHYKLDNLTVFYDSNKLQIDGQVSDVMNVSPVDEKFAAFGWHVQIIDGHDVEQIVNAIEEAKRVEGKPSVIICNTVKGKGVSFMENQAGWHGKAPNEEQYNTAMDELNAMIRKIEVDYGK